LFLPYVAQSALPGARGSMMERFLRLSSELSRQTRMEGDAGRVRVGSSTVEHLLLPVNQAAMKALVPR
jgi:hypothetical protein